MIYLVDFIDTTSQTAIDDYLSAHACTIIKVYSAFDKTYLVNTDVDLPHTDIIESIIDDNSSSIKLLDITSISPTNRQLSIMPISSINENDWWKLYSLKDISGISNNTINIPRYGENVNVYLVDSGINSAHQDFMGVNIIKLYSFTNEEPDPYLDTTGHGTALASLISGKNCGITNATIKVVKIFDKNISTKLSDLLGAFDKILSDFLLNPKLACIVNLSWTIDKNEYVENKIQKLIDSGMNVVCAAGNSGLPIDNVTPACMNDVITIGAYNDDFLPCDFSNYSSNIDITNNVVNGGNLDGWAPGMNIQAAMLDGTFGIVGGTSAAAAIHSATLAYNLSRYITDTGNLTNHLQNLDYTSLAGLGLSRQNLLNLSDPKYKNSVNKITTIANTLTIDTHDLSNLKTIIGFKETGQIFAFNPDTTSTVLFDPPLPTNYVIEAGWVIRNWIDIPTDYKIEDYLVTITDTQGKQLVRSLKFVMLSDTFNQVNYLENDPIIKIVAALSCTVLNSTIACSRRSNCGGAGPCFDPNNSTKDAIKYCDCAYQ